MTEETERGGVPSGYKGEKPRIGLYAMMRHLYFVLGAIGINNNIRSMFKMIF